MKKTANGWTVIDEQRGVLMYEYAFRKGSYANAMTMRLADGSLALISPPYATSDGAMRDLESFGKVTALVANNSWHHMGLPEWQRANPDARVYAADIAMGRVQKQRPELTRIESTSALESKLAKDCSIAIVAGSRAGDTWIEAGKTWFVSDCFFNMPKAPPGIVGLLFKLTKSAPGLSLSGVYKAFFVQDKPALKRFLLDALREKGPEVLITSHGQLEAGANLGARMRQLVETRL